MRATSIFVAGAVACAVLSGATESRSSPSYPAFVNPALKNALGSSVCDISCTLCHRDNNGGAGTLIAFGLNMKATVGLTGASQTSKIDGWFSEYFKTDHDSDGDGQTDRAELLAGSSPSLPGGPGVGALCSDMRYGCGARVAPAAPGTSATGVFGALLAGLMLGLWAYRRRVSG